MSAPHFKVTDIDLSRHGVIEASAGTGKTYTIEQIVLRMLLEEEIALDQILIVTYTEKATGELKTRLRNVLERAATASEQAGIRRALEQFDTAPIFTIHAFCQRMLQEYPLEQKQDFQSSLVDDPQLLQTLLREVQHKDWRSKFGNQLQTVLEKAGYRRDKAAAWDRQVLELAVKYKPRCGHQLRPTFKPDWWQNLAVDADAIGQLEIFTVELLHERLREYKRQRGMQSFDDMISAVERSLDPEANPEADRFLEMLRERFRYGIVDEFQDTDPLQWNIFRRIFLQGGSSKLFVVGDPKQAIFNFRGADLPTFIRATREMVEQHRAVRSSLNVNYRSDPNLIDALNCLFQDGLWFKGTEIRYHHVEAPDADERQWEIFRDDPSLPALCIVDHSHEERLKTAHRKNARFIAQEIRRLLDGRDGSPLLTIRKTGQEPRPIDASDICILVMRKVEANPIMEALDQAGLAYSFYKLTGLWQSDDADHLQILLQSLAYPQERASFRKALLTCFFRIKPSDLARAPDLPFQHPARQLYQSWLQHVQNRAWSSLFRSLLEDTGLLFLDAGSAGGFRRVGNLRQMLAGLEQAAHELNLDLLGMLDWMRAKRRVFDANDVETQPVESSRPRIKIMTIHASKGLEFPIVFLGGGFTQARNDTGLKVYHEDDKLIFEVADSAEGKARVLTERIDEQRRLLYVALTRANFKLYVPKVQVRRNGPYVGPVGRLLLPALETSCPERLPDTEVQIVRPALFDVTPTEDRTAVPAATEKRPIAIEGPLIPVVDATLGRRRIAIRSFTSMSRRHLVPVGEGATFGDAVPTVEDEGPGTLDRDDPLRGPVFGDMVHKVLEEIDFAEVGQAANPEALERSKVRRVIDEQVRKNVGKLYSRTPVDRLDEACRKQIGDLVWRALRTPLAALGGPLSMVPATDRIAEVEFLFPERALRDDRSNVQRQEGFVTGFMDLLLHRNGRYFLLDWKTNLLPAYGREYLDRCMEESDYLRQYRLYLHALNRWLTRVHGADSSLHDRIGGVYYLFIRGMNGRDESAGVYFHCPTDRDFDLEPLLRS